MAKGYALHLGLNVIDAAHYGTDGKLAGCHKDAHAMAALAKKAGYKAAGTLLDKQATADAFIDQMLELAETVESGDILFLTYSGHGSQVPDVDGDEGRDRKDETWCLYDRMLIDDELWRLFARFEAGVRILMLSDSCHSGTVARVFPAAGIGKEPPAGYGGSRALEPEFAMKAYDNGRSVYRAVQAAASGAEKATVGAGILLISGCQDKELSLDGTNNGLFTGTLLQVWNNGDFDGNYGELHRKIKREISDHQNPNLFKAGDVTRAFLKQKPFTI